MQILYALTMIAIFVLCAVLLVTARRILRASPLQSGELALSRMHKNTDAYDASEEDPETEIELPELGAIEAVRDTAPIEAVAAAIPAEPIVPKPVETQRAILTIVEPAENKKTSARRPDSKPATRVRKSVAPAYTSLLEGFLIGVSLVVLVQTQRSNSRARAPRSSRRRVA